MVSLSKDHLLSRDQHHNVELETSRAGTHQATGSLAIFAAIRRASSLPSNLAAERRPAGAAARQQPAFIIA